MQETEQQAGTKTTQLTGRIADLMKHSGRYTEASAKMALEDLIEKKGNTEFDIGAILSSIQFHGLFPEDTNFEDYISGIMGKGGYRRGLYFINIFNTLRDLSIPWEDIEQLGWTKIRHLTKNPTILTTDNWEEWVLKAEDLTVAELEIEVKGKDSKPGPASKSGNDSSLWKVKLYTDQQEGVNAAIEKAKTDIGSDSNAQAFEAVCLSYVTKVDPSTEVVPQALPSVVELIEDDVLNPDDKEVDIDQRESYQYIDSVMTALDVKFEGKYEINVDIKSLEGGTEA